VSAELDDVIRRLEAIEQGVRFLVDQRTARDFYSIAEFAKIVGRSEFTCREWCRLGRVKGLKKRSGRGLSSEWVVGHDELLRFQREGLLPLRGASQAAVE
jgi:transposase